MHIVCGHCDAVVGLPSDRMADKPRCPQCHVELIDGKTIALTSANFDQHLSRNDLPLVVDFWAPWCGPCRQMAPFYEQAAQTLKHRLRFGKLNTDEETAPAERYRIKSIPTLIVFRHGKEVARESGARGAAALVAWLESVL
jgi:thioredoxin 2